MQVALHNQVATYNLTAGKSLPEWLAERRKNRRNAPITEDRVELLQDLEFPHSTRCLFRCPNGTHVFSAGEYPYRLKCYDVNDLGLKYSFNADMPIMSGVALGADYRKFALRGEGRQLTVHHTAAIVDRLRVPHMQRDLGFNPFTAELLSVGASSAVHRVSLELGSFTEPYETSCEAINSVAVALAGPAAGLVLCAGADGVVEAWDSRVSSGSGGGAAHKAVARVALTRTDGGGSDGIGEARHVSVDSANGGLLFAAGCESGEVFVYDVRLQRPLLVKDHMNNLPIVKTYFFEGRSACTGAASHVVSADTRTVKIWHKETGDNFTAIDAPAPVTDFMLFKQRHNVVAPDSRHVLGGSGYNEGDSGVIGICCDVPRVQVHFVPQLAPAPRWAAFLDVIAEDRETRARHQPYAGEGGEAEEEGGQQEVSVYEDYTFIPQAEMESLGLTAGDLAGGRVRPAMHGAFVENRLYRDLKALLLTAPSSRGAGVESPHEAAQQRRRQRREEERISKFRRPAPGDDAATAAERRRQEGLETALRDPRFAGKISGGGGPGDNPYAIDSASPDYQRLLRVVEQRRGEASARRARYESDLFTIVPETGGGEAAAAEDGQGDAGAGLDEVHQHLRGVQSSGKLKRQRHAGKDKARDGGAAAPKSARTEASAAGDGGGRRVTMYEVGAGRGDLFMRGDKAIHQARKKGRAERLTLEERLARAKKGKK